MHGVGITDRKASARVDAWLIQLQKWEPWHQARRARIVPRVDSVHSVQSVVKAQDLPRSAQNAQSGNGRRKGVRKGRPYTK